MKKALVVSGVLLLLLIWKTPFVSQSRPSYAQNLPEPFPTNTPQPEKLIDEVVVVFNKKPTTGVLLNLASQASEVKPEHGIASSNAMVFTVRTGGVNEAIAKLSQNQNVKAAFPNHRLRTLKTSNDPALPNQWNLFNLNLASQGNSAWDVTSGSQAVSVAVIDTGVDSAHPDLAGKIASLVDCSGTHCLEVNTMSDPDVNGHGTHVTGLIVASTNNTQGIASSGYDTRASVIKIMDASGTMSISSFLNAIVWSADHGAKIINLSLGQLEENLDIASINEMNQKIAYAWSKGTFIVTAAGNCGGNTNGNSDCAIVDDQGNVTGYAVNSKMYPAASPNVLAVAALSKSNTLASYSERNDSNNTKIGNWISVAAPGGECNPDNVNDFLNCILSTVPRNLLPTPPLPTPPFDPYFINMGTSMASPQVAGVAALVLAVNPNLTNAESKTLIEATANKSIAVGATNYGAVDALAAVTAASGGNIPSVTPGGPTVTTGPVSSPTPTSYPTIPPRMRNAAPSPFPTGPYCPQTFLPGGNCTLESKNQGDANCDGVVNALDFSLWLNQLDQMVPPKPVNQNANFSCVEGNITTYFIDLVDYEIWRRFTTSGLVTPGPTAPPSPTSGPSPTSMASDGCVNTGCVTACVRVNKGRPGGMTDWTSSDVTVRWGDFVEFKPEPFDGVTVFWYPASEPNKVYRQCSSNPGAGQTCPAVNTLGSEYGIGTSSIVAFKYINNQWWMKGENDVCSDTLTLNIQQ